MSVITPPCTTCFCERLTRRAARTAPSRTDAVAVAAMETVRGVDAAGKRSADTARRTDDAAPLTADTLVRIDAVSAFPCRPRRDRKEKHWRSGREAAPGQNTPLAFVNPKDFPARHSFFRTGMRFFGHIRVFLKNLRQTFLSNAAHRTPQGNRQGGRRLSGLLCR